MTREQIEKRAVAIKDSQNYHMSFEDAQDYISKCGFDIPWNDGDVFVDDREITRTIGNVLKWRINSVWHDTCDIAEPGNDCLVEYMDGDGNVCIRIDRRSEYEWINACHYDKILRWAYISDLIPERKEETE